MRGMRRAAWAILQPIITYRTHPDIDLIGFSIYWQGAISAHIGKAQPDKARANR